MSNKRFNKPPAARPPLSDREKELMMQAILLDDKVYAAARTKLEPAHFSQYENGYRLLWECLRDLRKVSGAVPSQSHLLGAIESRLNLDPTYLTEEELDELSAFIAATYMENADSDHKTALSYLRQFLSERLIERTVRMLSGMDTVPEDVVNLFSGLEVESRVAASVEATGVRQPFDDDWEPEPLHLSTTGMPCLDNLLGGGQASAEVYGLLGPFGSCKTTLMIQLSIHRAREARKEWERQNKSVPLGVSYYVQYEEPVNPSILLRAISCFGKIERAALENYNRKTLSTSTNLKPYELKLFAQNIAAGSQVLGERERMDRAKKLLNVNWRAIDMSGADEENPSRGSGGVEELSAIIAADLEENPNTYVAGVYVDYVKAACEKYLSARNQDHKEMRHLVGNFPLKAKELIAIKYDCPVWLAHQLSGEANAQSPGRAQHHSSAAESKSFPENLDFNVAIGSVTKDQLCLLSVTKQRRAPRRADAIVHIEGNMSIVKDVTHEYMWDSSTRQFVKSADFYRVADDGNDSSDRFGYPISQI